MLIQLSRMHASHGDARPHDPLPPSVSCAPPADWSERRRTPRQARIGAWCGLFRPYVCM